MGRDGNEIRRRRECLECQRRFTTRERVEEVFPKVVKRDERREEYDRAKLEHKCFKAAHELIDKGMRESFSARGKKKRRRSAA